MLKCTINAEGKTDFDIQCALEEALRLIKAGNFSGMNSNDDGEFDFQITGEEEVVGEEVDRPDTLIVPVKKTKKNVNKK